MTGLSVCTIAPAPGVAPRLEGAELEAATRVAELLAGAAPLGVAVSGGVDSATLLALAARALRAERVVAVLGVSPSLAREERVAAHRVARFIGVRVVEVRTHELEDAEYRRNAPDRCFHCKHELFTRITDEVVARERLVAVAYGENADDALAADRPGARAAVAHRVLRPLADAGIDKASVRRIARALALPCADKPAAPCLASRIPHFEEVSAAKLAQIESAEAALRALGFTRLRVRHHGRLARIELPTVDLARAVAPDTRAAIRRAVLAAGFSTVAVDLAGLQPGAFSMRAIAAADA